MMTGKLRHRLDVQAFTEVVDPSTGYRTKSWATVHAAVPADIEPLSGREFLAAAASQSQVTSRIIIRYLPGITAAHRLVEVLAGSEQGAVYDIHAVLPDNKTGRDHLTLMCSEGAGDG